TAVGRLLSDIARGSEHPQPQLGQPRLDPGQLHQRGGLVLGAHEGRVGVSHALERLAHRIRRSNDWMHHPSPLPESTNFRMWCILFARVFEGLWTAISPHDHRPSVRPGPRVRTAASRALTRLVTDT